jgi:hypothetical protein
MSSKQGYTVGTTVCYEGDDTNRGGFGKISDVQTDYLGELEFEITLEDGRVLTDITLADFEPPQVLGETGVAEFHVVDAWESKMWDEGMFEPEDGFQGLIGDDSFFHEELSPQVAYMR